MRTCVTSTIHTKTGIQRSCMPGARMLMIVTTKLRAPRMDETPSIWMARIQKSRWGPGENCRDVRLA